MKTSSLKDALKDYTEAEFIKFLQEFLNAPEHIKGTELDRYTDRLVAHFERITEHPSGSDLLFWPEPGQDDSPEGILHEVKRWRATQGLPGFKPE